VDRAYGGSYRLGTGAEQFDLGEHGGDGVFDAKDGAAEGEAFEALGSHQVNLERHPAALGPIAMVRRGSTPW